MMLRTEKIYFVDFDPIYTAGDTMDAAVAICGGSKGFKLFDVQVTLMRLMDNPIVPPPPTKDSSSPKWTPIPVATYCSLTIGENPLTVAPDSNQKFKFSIKIPPGLWSTFHSKMGDCTYRLYIQYKSKYRLNFVEWGAMIKEIVIIGRVTLVPRSYLKPFVSKKVFKNKEGKEVASITVNVDQTNVIPGDKLSFKMEIYNGTGLPLANAKLVLRQNISYNFKNFSIYKGNGCEAKNKLCKDGPIIPPGIGRIVNWIDSIEIPHVVPSGLGSDPSPYIKVSYELMFLVSKFVNLKVKVPLHIGTKLKLEDEEDTISMAYGLEMTRSEFSSLDSVSLGSSYASSLDLDRPPRYSELETPPPRYWEIMTGSQASLNI